MANAKWGVCLDQANPGGRPHPSDLALFGWARLVVRDAPEFAAYVAELTHAGIRVIATLTNQSLPDDALSRGPAEFVDNEGRPFTAEFWRVANPTLLANRVAAYAATIAPAAWELGNEPDDRSENEASLRMLPGAYREFATACASAIRGVQRTAVLLTGGLDSGDPSWLARCGPLPVDGIAIHPYGKQPTADWPDPPLAALPFGVLGELLDGYAAVATAGERLWITEFGTPHATVHSEYYRRVFDAITSRSDLVAACAFAWSDAVGGEHGLNTWIEGTNHFAARPAMTNLTRHPFP